MKKNWLAGLIDGDGYFQIPTSTRAKCRISMHEKEVETLREIQKHFNGAVERPKTTKCMFWSLGNKKEMRVLLEAVNGRLLTEIRFLQFAKACTALGIEPRRGAFSKESEWLVGFFDAEGCLYIDRRTGKVHVIITQKKPAELHEIAKHWLGRVYYATATDSWRWMLYKQEDILAFCDYLLANGAWTKRKEIELFCEYIRMEKKNTEEILARWWAIKNKLW